MPYHRIQKRFAKDSHVFDIKAVHFLSKQALSAQTDDDISFKHND